MLDHIVIGVKDYDKSREFYARALAPLGAKLVMEFGSYGGFGKDGKPSFWITSKAPDFWREGHSAGSSPIHLAFVTTDRKAVDLFHAAAVAAGATDNGAPGVRAKYHPNYYGAFVIDLDGNNIEAVCHT